MIATRNQMLRITRKANGEVVFKVSGQLTGENVTEIETLIAAETKGRRIVLDCTDLRSVDSEAVKFLEKWEADSIKLKNCGLYIREWIRRERLERKSGKSSETSRMVRFGAMATEIPLVCSNPNANILYSTLARRPKPSRGAAVTSARTRAAISRHFIGV